MKKVLAAGLSVLFCLLTIAVVYKLAMPRTSVTPDDMLIINEIDEGTLNNSAGVQGDGDFSSVSSDEPESSPILIQSEPSPEQKTQDGQEKEEKTNSESTPVPTPTPTPTPSPAPTPEPTTSSSSSKPLMGLIIGVDPGHQAKSNKETEPVAPGSSTMKAKVSSGTAGKFTGIAEHVVNLNVGLHLKKMLEDAGATVIMTRETADVNISNVERAKLFNANNVDLGIRLHCNGSTDESVRGAFMLVPKDKNYPYYDECVKAAKAILEAYGKRTGIGVKKGITYRDDQTGFNWCERTIVNIEMGHMSNKEEDELITNKDFQKKMALGIYEGVVEYFNDKIG